MCRWLAYFLLSSVWMTDNCVVSFTPSSVSVKSKFSTSELYTETVSSSIKSEDDTSSSLKRDRYVATNRFAVRSGKECKFEQRWAKRKSRLATLDGFKYFHLMRRVDSNDGSYVHGDDDVSILGNYVSFTVWEKKSHFSAWRKGDAFKEAHGGTSIGAFVSTLVNSAIVLKGAPRPAFYDGLMVQSTEPESIPQLVDGWRNLEYPEDSILPEECFVACNQFFVPFENSNAFEQRWANRESALKECSGFVGFSMLRRDIRSNKGHGTVPVDTDIEPTYVSTAIWKDRASFQSWKDGKAFSKSHGAAKQGTSPPSNKPLWSKPPTPVFYEGTLVITTKDGI
uniref:ABM domain-containing protein n=1 Tax=Eucampia antarctica TaxID=49252 RepID=A0A7S2R1V0_9STRA|mmetsp:Transcript_13585/g.13169  ORF Transcript_13585/g.13169 Transcript_13585/m.13169 type:complete len:339 (+) Transcript_13585:87-1103(+)|eukprot:CAMPEP_0197831982 /NCGR_PEP_ID=MMETSP1437-20131217/12884_1 /TAXON_ID=49252 ORGANISM="Eucampia antarctica, Strain CCMP1452" /NCGR_SAMPLE_ID=MMETSP1437 /ASSEMBLY_ACC=CAM_ASM_001096 /LENGTH=338 /DNA_ID=CAMNT_0043435137 /DNA_START=60 /DNA_END=1076 /DNA_ORIENTATION=+